MSSFNRFFFVGMLAGAMLAVGVPLLIFGAIGMAAQSSGKPPTVVGLRPLAFPDEPAAALSWEVRDMAGQRHDVANLSETVLFVNNWATWCGPCLIEMPAIDALARRYEADDVAFVIVSEEQGYAKPDPRVYRDALTALGLASPEAVLFVGDNPVTDIAGARAFGMQTAWVSRGRAFPTELVAPDLVIERVTDLRGVLGV